MKIGFTRALFSLNSFVAAMLALYIALSLGLLNPFWSMMTVYIVSQPQAGSVRSKALYRLLGTIIGGTASVAIIPLLSNAPELLSLALALWVGMCLTIALLDRTPRSYVFMLGGYTAALIGFSTVNNPASVFDISVARVEEIGLGIICATLVHSIVNPQGVGSTLTAQITGFMRDAQSWTLDALGGRHAASSSHAHKLAADVTNLYILGTHLPFDTSDFQTKSREVSRLSERMAMLLPLAAVVGDRLMILRQEQATLSPEAEALLADVTDWIAAGLDAQVEDAGPLIERARALVPEIGPDPDMDEMMRASFHARLIELITVYRDCRMLSRHFTHDEPLPADAPVLGGGSSRQALHLDYGMAAWSGISAVVATLLVCAFWIMSGWNDGGTAAMMTAIFMCFFATMDDPAKAIDSFILYTLLGIPIAALYLFAILPPLDSFPMLVLALAPFLLFCGYLIAIPAFTIRALPVLIGVSGSLAIQESFSPDFAHFLNSSIAMIVGCIAASAITRLIRSIGADVSARRIIRSAWRDIARSAAARRPPDRTELITRMVDRVGLLGPRLAVMGDSGRGMAEAMGDLRAGLNILALHALRRGEGANPALDDLLAMLGRHFDLKARGRIDVPSPEILSHIDMTIFRTSRGAPSTPRHDALLALAGLRRLLFPQSTMIERPAT